MAVEPGYCSNLRRKNPCPFDFHPRTGQSSHEARQKWNPLCNPRFGNHVFRLLEPEQKLRNPIFPRL